MIPPEIMKRIMASAKKTVVKEMLSQFDAEYGHLFEQVKSGNSTSSSNT